MGQREQRVEVELVEGARMVATVGEHKVNIDLPEKLGGADTAPTPTELLMAAIGACKLFYSYRFLSRRGTSTDGATATITWESSKKAVEVARVSIDVPGGISPEHLDGCHKMAAACFVSTSIESDMKIELTLK